MRNFVSVIVISLLISAVSCSIQENQVRPPADGKAGQKNSLLVLENDRIAVGMLPAAGAHVVLFRTTEGQNILNSDARLWTSQVPDITSEPPPFLPYNGHIYWLSPQNGWWLQQDINADRKARKAVWPPDPYLTLGKYEVLEQSTNSIRLISPRSPVSGLQLIKDISIRENKVVFKVTATNVRQSDVSWGIWSNTRLSGSASVYVPIDKERSQIKIEYNSRNSEKERVLPYDVTGGFLHYDIAQLLSDKEHVFTSKTFICPAEPLIAAFSSGCLFIKRTDPIQREKIHPDQFPVEIFKYVGNTKDTLTELEMHGAYTTLKPGESMSFEESWELIPCGDLPGTAERIDFLKEKLSQR